MAPKPISQWCFGRFSSQAQVLLVLGLLAYIVYSPIHLILEPHSDRLAYEHGARPAIAECAIGNADGESDHHDAHSAAGHEFKSTQAGRMFFPDLPLLPLWGSETPDPETPQPQQLFAFSGLSPPEFCCSWQFTYRAALPVRAPSFGS